jgi:hypothetical protein
MGLSSINLHCEEAQTTKHVMAGLVRAIHVFYPAERKQDVDHRDKRGDDRFCAETDWINRITL